MNIELIEEFTLRLQTSTRGGGIEIDLGILGFKKYEGHKMTAYQNYLGGGMLGRVANDCTFPDWRSNRKLTKAAKELGEYFHNLTNPEEDEFESLSYKENQQQAVSAY